MEHLTKNEEKKLKEGMLELAGVIERAHNRMQEFMANYFGPERFKEVPDHVLMELNKGVREAMPSMLWSPFIYWNSKSDPIVYDIVLKSPREIRSKNNFGKVRWDIFVNYLRETGLITPPIEFTWNEERPVMHFILLSHKPQKNKD